MKRNNTLCRIFALSLCFVFIFLLGCNQPPKPPVMEPEYKAAQKSWRTNDDYFDWEKYGDLTPPEIESIEWNGETVQLEYIRKTMSTTSNWEIGARYVFTDVETKRLRLHFDEKGRLLYFKDTSRAPSGDTQITEQEAIELAKSVLSQYVDVSEYTVSCILDKWYGILFSKSIGDYDALDYVYIEVSHRENRILYYESRNLGRVPKNLDTGNIDSERCWTEVKKVLDEIYSDQYSAEEIQQFEHEIADLFIVPLSGDTFGLEYHISSRFMDSAGKYKTRSNIILVK